MLTKNVIMKEATIRDVNFILKLRTNKNLSKYINISLREKIKKNFILYFF